MPPFTSPRTSRRNFLKTLAAGGAALSIGPLQDALAAMPTDAFRPVSASTTADPVHHVISRLTFGPTPELIEHVHTIGVEAFIEEQLHPENLDDSALDVYASALPDLHKNASQIFAEAAENGGDAGYIARQLVGNWAARAMHSRRQLYERMVHFWSDHFSIYTASAQLVFLKVDDDRDVIRAHALGNFRELLGASAHSPAMLAYLDNAVSEKTAPNENYARELLELHTLGIDGGYTELDVKEVARCLTGWSVTRPRQAFRGQPLTFQFYVDWHDDGEKTFLGHTIPSGGGQSDGETVLDIAASHPSTARFISTKLARRFVADNPPQTLVEACAQTFMDTGGDIRSVLRTLFHSDEFWNAPPKFKRPFEYTVSVLRGLNYTVEDPMTFVRVLGEVLRNMGHMPFRRSTPDGYPDTQADWADNLLMRWNIAIAGAHGGVPGLSSNLKAVLDANNIPLEAEPVLAFMAQQLYGHPLTADENAVLQAYLAQPSDQPIEDLQDALALLLAAPVFQYR